MIGGADEYDPDALFRDPCDDPDSEGQECPVCGEPLVWEHGEWRCSTCAGEVDDSGQVE